VVLVVACVGAAASLAKLRQTIEDVPVVDIGSALTPTAEVSEPRNFLIIGTDSAEGLDEDDPVLNDRAVHGLLADVIMILRIDPRDQSARLISIPRDSRVELPDGRMDRINAAMAGVDGEATLVQTIKRNFGISIDNYVQIDFAAFRDLVEVLGGVPVYFTTPVRDRNSGLAIDEAGCHMLDPGQALAYARARHFYWYDEELKKWRADPTGDLGRISRQQDFIKRALRRAADKGLRNPNTAMGVINAASSSVKMDSTLDVGTLLSLAGQFQTFNPESLQSVQVPTAAAPRGGVAYQDVLWDEAEPLLEPFRGVDPATGPAPRNVIVTVQGTAAQREQLDQSVAQLDTAGFDADVKEQRSGSRSTTIYYGPNGRDAAVLLASQLGVVPQFEMDDSIRGYRVVLAVGDDFDGVREQAVPIDQLPADQLPPRTDEPQDAAGPETTESSAPETTETLPEGDMIDDGAAEALEDEADVPGIVPTDPGAAALCR
jgi:LCP family protein required for cell wall assembly